MRGRFRISTLSKTALRAWLALLFLALALPTAALVRQAYGQLKWESFHHYRGLAEDLTRRMDTAIAALVEAEDRRSFADYSFLVVEGDSQSNFVQRSELARFPVSSDVPGVLGYFQVDGEGRLTTPLLQPPGSPPSAFGIPPREYAGRLAAARRIADVLRDNRLVQGAQAADGEARRARTPEASASAGRADDDVDRDLAAAPPERRKGQAAFEALSGGLSAEARQAAVAGDDAPVSDRVEAAGAGNAEKSRANSLGKVADLNLETPFEGKLASLEESVPGASGDGPGRGSRKEQVALPEPAAPAADEVRPADFYQKDVRIDTFESEIDPFEFSLIDSGHFVLFRKVWRNQERFIQGILIESDAFLGQIVDEPFRDTVTADMSDLIVAYDEDVIHTASGHDAAHYTGRMLETPAPLLYRARLSSPLDRLELIYRIRNLPPGPGAAVLGWMTVVLAVVFSAGFYALYRLGAGQIDLARQQQDFVSAVSHELKTPLTSIRMYGEMLREGWADPGKQQQYYAYIHDESERLTRLISNVLQLSGISRNNTKLDIRPAAVADLMSDLEACIANQVRLGGFELRMLRDARADAAVVAVDRDGFMQIVINLVDNAIKFSRHAANRSVEVASGEASDGRIRISVRDYGPGVPRDQMKKIFRLFYRSGDELTRETVGTGIGLAIVLKLALAMGGEIDVANRDPGAEFILLLPRA